MTTGQFEALIRNIISHGRLPFTFQSVSPADNAWHVVLCDESGAALSLTVLAGRPIDVRNAIAEQLETAIEDGAPAIRH